MTERKELAANVARALRRLADRSEPMPAVVGFDGFVDLIIDVVDKRHDLERYDPVNTIAEFSDKVAAAAGQSANYELVIKQRKLGGNGPIMANALAGFGFDVDYVGNLGEPSVDPVFAELDQRATIHSLAPPGYTHALEFSDGKLMLGQHETLRRIDQARIDERIGRERYIELLDRARLIACVNWTMLPGMNELFAFLLEEALPRLSPGERYLFIDLADPEKRTDADLKHVLETVSAMQAHVDVILGLNLKESSQVARVLGIEVAEPAEDRIRETAAAVRDAVDLRACVVHPRRSAAAAVAQGPLRGAADSPATVDAAFFEGPFVRKPRLSTGAGDNFNAGFCLGVLAGLDAQHAICCGTAASGFYVREARSATVGELADFLDRLPEPEGR